MNSLNILILICCHQVSSLGHYDLYEDYDLGSQLNDGEDNLESVKDYAADFDYDYYQGEKDRDKGAVYYDHFDDFDEDDPDLGEMGNPIDSSNIALPWEFADDMSKLYKEEL